MINFRLASQEDADDIAELYYEAFKGSHFNTIFGREAVHQFYSCFIKSDKAIVMIAEDDDRFVGFRAVSLDGRGFERSLVKKNLWLFLRDSVVFLFTKPVLSIKFLLNWFRNVRQSDGKEAFAKNYGYAVVKSYRGRGIGSSLAMRTEECLKSMGVKRIEMSVESSKVGELNLCRYMGYEITHEFTYYPDRKMYYLVKKF